MQITYETVIAPNEFGGYDVDCPDLMPHATWTASDAANAAGLGAYVTVLSIQRHMEEGTTLPQPTSGHKAGEGGFVLHVGVDTQQVCNPLPGYTTVADAAEMLGVSTSRVRALARAGRLVSRKYGNLWFISLESLQDRIDHPRKAGRPPKRRNPEELVAA
jgi:excisionase family DNA binding protein